MALFGEKYGDEVRVVAMGQGQDGKDYSVELCGGTHVRRTGDIGYFKIVSEGAVSSGVRRLEVLTSDAACDYSAKQEALLVDALSTLKTTPSDLVGRLGALLNERKSMEKEIADLQKKVALGGGGNSSGDDVKEIAGVKFLGQVLEGIPAKELRGLADDAKKRIGSGVVAFIAVNEGKAAVLTAVTDDLKDKISAVDLVRAGANAVGGKGGGGRPDMAQAGGPDGSNAADAIKAIEGVLG
jgi:alanyl-tRNA synthetase